MNYWYVLYKRETSDPWSIHPNLTKSDALRYKEDLSESMERVVIGYGNVFI